MEDHDHLLDGKGQVRRDLIEDLLVEVISGKVVFESGRDLYASRSPLMHEQDKARIVYTRRLHECRARAVPNRSELEALAMERGYFDPAERREMAALEDMVQRSLKARDNTRDPQQKVELAGEIENLRRKLFDLRVREEEVLAHSAEARADEARTSFLVSCCTLSGELLDQPVWNSWEDFQTSTDYRLIADGRRAFLRAWQGLPIKIIRAIARSHEWRTRWKAAVETGTPLFEGHGTDWDANKRNLVWWSEFYDGVHRHPECPPEATINDDEALQDWLNQQIAKRNNRQEQRAGEKAPPTYIDGHGRRQQMVRVGEKTIQVGQPYRVRV